MNDTDMKYRKTPEKIPDAVVRRMKKYLDVLDSGGIAKEYISSEAIANATHTSAVRVRLDLSFFGNFGSKRGYACAQLRSSIREILGLTYDQRVVVVASDPAMYKTFLHPVFNQYGFMLPAYFSTDPADVDELGRAVTTFGIKIGVLATSAVEAQQYADILCESGVIAILNTTAAEISVPFGVKLETLRLEDSLLSVSYALGCTRCAQGKAQK